MRWETLLVLLFLLLPMIQGLLERGKEQPPAPEEDEDDLFAGELPPPVPRQAAPRQPAPVMWDARPEVPPQRPRERPIPAERAAPEVVSMEPVAPRPVPVRPTQDVDPDRAAEHERFHRKVAPVTLEVAKPRAAPRLGSVDEIRRAIVLAAILGPPRALRSLEDEER